jgi:hypothetical protein
MQRRGGTRYADPSDVFFTAVQPRRERAYRCCALLTEYLPGGCLRDVCARGALFPGGWTPQVGWQRQVCARLGVGG